MKKTNKNNAPEIKNKKPDERIIDSDSDLYKSIKVKKNEPGPGKKVKLNFDNLERYYLTVDKHVHIKRIGNKLYFDNEKNIELPYFDTIIPAVADQYRKLGRIY
jgi:NAD kinase